MSKKKDEAYYKNRRNKVREKKRKLTSSAGSMTAEQVKNEKQSLKREYRGLKRSERNQVTKEIKLELDDLVETMKKHLGKKDDEEDYEGK